ncbi:hypothetical protein ACFFMS_00980 [Ectobacillus funiculus]|uniref:Uncharacterized protein n=1 Tax=Ectobacillus funiculus TaxID=137993 RepID=A0ABV5W9Q7_9BACI
MSKDIKKTFADSGKGLARHSLHVNKAGESNDSPALFQGISPEATPL